MASMFCFEDAASPIGSSKWHLTLVSSPFAKVHPENCLCMPSTSCWDHEESRGWAQSLTEDVQRGTVCSPAGLKGAQKGGCD